MAHSTFEVGPVVEVSGAEPLQRSDCQVVAEAGANHNNSIDRAIEMATAAAAAGAWAIKFQFYKAHRLAMRDSPKYWTDEIGTASQFEAFQKSDKLDYDEYRPVAEACRDLGIVFFSTPFDFEAVEAMEDMDCPLYKVASGDITHRPLLELIASTNKPVLLSTGAARTAEIEDAVGWLGGDPSRLVILACTLTYPTPDEDANFARILEIGARFPGFLAGFSDHTLGPEGGFMAGALGGVCIEKHYTLDKGLGDVPDHHMSVDPRELELLVQYAHRAALLRGAKELEPEESELAARTGARRSIVVIRDMKAGETIGSEDLDYRRPGAGLPPSAADRLIGRPLTRDVQDGEALAVDDVA